MSYYLVIFQGGGALGSAAFGVLAQSAGLHRALLIAAAVGLVLVAVAGLRLPFKAISPDELLPAGDWPSPQLVGATRDRGAGAGDGRVPAEAGLEQDSSRRCTPGATRDAARARSAGACGATPPTRGASSSSSSSAPGTNTCASTNASAAATSSASTRSRR